MVSKYAVQHSEEEWRKKLSPEQYRVLREKGTEPPHSGKYNLHFQDGEYRCAVFDDGPTETGQRFCVNSASIDFNPKK